MKIRSDSLYAQLARLGLLDDIFGFIAADAPGYDALHAWLSERGLHSSNGALHNLITHHMGTWRINKAIQAADEACVDLPANADDTIRNRLHGLRLDLALRDLSEKTAVSLLKLDLAERELASKNQGVRDAGVQALMDEAKGNAAAEAALTSFLAALDSARVTSPTPPTSPTGGPA
jgi:hypothetical protein